VRLQTQKKYFKRQAGRQAGRQADEATRSRVRNTPALKDGPEARAVGCRKKFLLSLFLGEKGLHTAAIVLVAKPWYSNCFKPLALSN